MSKLTGLYVDFSYRYHLTPEEAVTVPALFEHAAGEVDKSPEELINAALRFPEVGRYMASVAREVAAKI